MYGGHSLDIDGKQVRSFVDCDPFKIPKNDSGESELVEQPTGQYVDMKDYEVFAVTSWLIHSSGHTE